MFCSECGKEIADDALFCPKCGAVTKNGIITLKNQETSDRINATTEAKDNIASSAEKRIKTLNIVAIVLGLVGSGALLLSLLGEFCSVTAPIIGTIPITMSKYLDKLIFVVFILAGLSILASFWRYAFLEITTGSITAIWAGYLIWKVQNVSTSSEYSGLVSVNYGVGVYLFVLAACLILASGIVNLVAAKNTQATDVEKKANKNKRSEIIISVCLGVLFACGIGGTLLFNNYRKLSVKKTVSRFMNAAILYDVDSMNSLLASDANDKNGFMEAYTPDIMSNSFLSNWGTKLSDLNSDSKAAVTETSVLFGKYYLKEYHVGDMTPNEDGSFTVKVSASILNMRTVDNKIQTASAEVIREYVDLHPEEITELYFELSTDSAVAKYLSVKLIPQMCSIINSAIRDAGAMETEFTFVVKEVDGAYKIIEIDYEDQVVSSQSDVNQVDAEIEAQLS